MGLRLYESCKKVYHKLPLPKKLKLLLYAWMHPEYARWIRRYDTLTEADRSAMRARIAGFAHPPRFSVLMPVYNTPDRFLRQAIESVRRQIYPHWELCIADDASTQSHVRRTLEDYARKDARIKVCFRAQNGHISQATNSALEMASADHVALLDHDDELAEHALYWMAEEIIAHPEAELLYSDVDKIDALGLRCDAYFKPDWNPDLLMGQNYVSHFSVYSRRRVLDIGGLRKGFEGAQDWDLVLRFTHGLAPRAIRHIPAVLYHWRMHPGSTAASMDVKPYASQAQYRSVSESLFRQGEQARLERVCQGNGLLPHFAVQGRPLVSIVIAAHGEADRLRRCLDSLRRTDYPHTEILVIASQSRTPKTLASLAEINKQPDCRVISNPDLFDFSARYNRVVPQARGEYVCLLDDGLEVVAPSWLDDMLGAAQRPGVGAVGAKLLYPDGRVQHGGVLLGIGGIASHAHRFFPGGSAGYIGRGILLQSFSAVSGACILLRKEHWLAAGGMCKELLEAYNDVDLCLRLQEMGLRTLWIPSALLRYHGAASLGPDADGTAARRVDAERTYMQRRWGPWLAHDPAYNPNLTLAAEDFSLAFPPRVRRPWRQEPLSSSNGLARQQHQV